MALIHLYNTATIMAEISVPRGENVLVLKSNKNTADIMVSVLCYMKVKGNCRYFPYTVIERKIDGKFNKTW